MTASPDASVVIIGAGHAGSGLAAVLRQSGFAGSLTIIGDECHLPYHRPPLSKNFDSCDVEQLLRPREFYAENKIDLRVGHSVRSIDLNTRVVATDSGGEIEYSTLVFATGSTPRSLPGLDPALAGVHTLRSLDDAHDLSESLARGGALVIVGGGYVGMEVAAVARSRGTPVTVIEREDRLLARVASAELSSMLADYHMQRGVTIRTNQSISGLRNCGDRAAGVVLADGRILDSDTVLVGIGARPADDLARAAGLECDDGIITDDEGRTSDPHVFAIGDVARRPVPGYAGLRRLESIPAATEHAKRAAAAITGTRPGHSEVPWFWSDQFDLKLKIAGLGEPDDLVITRPHSNGDAVSFFHLRRDNTVNAVESVNAPADFMAGKKLISSCTPIDPDVLADPSTSLKDLLSTATTRQTLVT